MRFDIGTLDSGEGSLPFGLLVGVHKYMIMTELFVPCHEKTCLRGCLTRKDSNSPAQIQMLARVLKFWI